MTQKNDCSVVTVEWKSVELTAGEGWVTLYSRFEDQGLTKEELQRCVYVIRVNGLFAIKYPKDVSPVIYIGKGQLKNRIKNHNAWMAGLQELVEEFSFQVSVCVPKNRTNVDVHCDMEAALIWKFVEMFGSIPLRNRRLEYEKQKYSYEPESAFKKPLMIGKGKRYLWSIRPMPANPYNRFFGREIIFD